MTPTSLAEVEQPFDLLNLARELRAGEPYIRDGHTARTLVRGVVLRVIFVVIREGSKMGEHRTKQQVSLHVVAGAVRVQLRDRSVELHTGQLLVLLEDEYHDIQATVDAALVLNIGWRAVDE